MTGKRQGIVNLFGQRMEQGARRRGRGGTSA